MNAEKSRTGRCLCGKVTFTMADDTDDVGVCHCTMCRRWAGAPWFAIHTEKPVTFEGEEHITRYRSSEWAERGFCSACGTNLFYHLLSSGDYIVSPHALDDQSGFTFKSQIFIDEKPDWYGFANETENMTGAEVFAMYAPKEGEQG